MAKATLEFDMNDPDDAKAFKRAVKSTDMAIVLFEITHNLRRIHPESEEVFKDIHDLLDLHGIIIHDIID